MKRTLVLCLIVVGCSQNRGVDERAERCIDGQDNDNDGLIDCADPDCSALLYCRSPLDGQSTQLPARDIGVSHDARGDAVSPPRSSYGRRCSFSGRPALCPDGKTVCVRSAVSAAGYCTFACSAARGCAPGPGGSRANCLYNFDGRNYCLFLCRSNLRRYRCPEQLDCFAYTSSQSICWSR